MSDEMVPPSSGSGPPDAELWRGRRSFRQRLFSGLAAMRQIMAAGFVVVFLLLLAVFIWFMLRRPVKPTPVIALQSLAYEWPLPPNAWAAEDIKRIRKLADFETIKLYSHVANSREGLLGFPSSLRSPDSGDGLPAEISEAETVIIYVSMHGVAKDGVPYLIPAGADADDANQWLEFSDLLKVIGTTFPKSEQKKLVVLDSSRIGVNWHLGLLSANEFSAAVEKWWNSNASDQADVAVLNSAGMGQQAWTSADLQGSVFGHFFHLGLAGDADENRNGVVTLEELNSYLGTRVNGWAKSNRAAVQAPVLLTSDASLVLANTVDRGELDRLRQYDPGRRTPFVSSADRESLWQSVESLRDVRLYGYEPLAWRDLEHGLLSLEQLSVSGSAYDRAARLKYEALGEQLARIEAELPQFHASRSIEGRFGLITGEYEMFAGDLPLRSLSLAEYFGAVKPTAAAEARQQLAQFQSGPNQTRLARAIQALDRLGLGEYVDARFLYMLERYQFPEQWRQSARLAELMRIRELSEVLGVPTSSTGGEVGDERAHYWVRGMLDSADEVRRDAEDRLYIDGQPELSRKLAAANAAYRSVAATSDDVTEAMQSRDRAWAEAAYLAQWLTDPLRRDAAADENANATMSSLIRATAELGGQLSDHAGLSNSATASAQVARIQRQEATVAEQLLTLEQAFRAQCEDLANSQTRNNVVELNGMRAALTIPLVPAETRSTLNDRVERVETTLHQEWRGKEPSALEPDAPRNVDVAQPSYDISVHPLLALFGEDEAGAAATKWNGRWQNGLDSLRAKIEESGRGASRSDLSQLEQKLRAIAPIWCSDKVAGGRVDLAQPFRNLRVVDLQALLLWHAERALGDFWGPAGDASPYFAAAANDYLGSAVELGHRSGFAEAGSEAAATALTDRVSRARHAARGWLSTTAESSVVLEPGDMALSRIDVQARLAEADLPTGSAALLVLHDDARLSGLEFNPSNRIELPRAGAQVDVAFTPQLAEQAMGRNDAMTLFRGHEYAGQFAIEPLAGVRVDHEPYVYDPGRVNLHSPWQKLAVVLVMDCSQSMEELFEGDQTQLTVAKDALQELLLRLGSQRNVRVGVRLFGHRVGWSTDRPVRMLTSPSYAGEIPADLTPDRDVETALPLSEMDYGTAQRLFEVLTSIEQGWGQSPLYLALDQALREDFAYEEADTDTCIIVITDGRNYQARPTAQDRRSLSDVLQASQASGVPVHILGLAMNGAADRQSAAEFTQLASQTGGSFKNLNSALDLQEVLRSLVRPGLYELDKSDGSIVDRGELGTPLSDVAQRDADSYTVRFENAQEEVWLEGGEEISFYVRPGGTSLHAFPYDHDVVSESLIDSATGGSMADYQFRVHRPLRERRDVHFPLSLQQLALQAGASSEDVWSWTRRPSAAWVEITPLSPSGDRAGQTYIFYDANYEPQKPVPALDLVARDWPGRSTSAVVEAWFQPQAVGPIGVLPLSGLLGRASAGTPVNRQIGGGITIQIDATPAAGPDEPYRVRVVERHASGAASVGSVRISAPRLDDLLPTRIVRQFDPVHGLVVHWFYYEAPSADLVASLRMADIAIETRQAVQRDALHAEPVVVKISESGDLLPLAGSWSAEQ